MELLISTLGSGDFPFSEDSMFWIIGGIIAIVAIISGSACTIFKTRSKERSRSEIAAYIAEGSMTPEDGERLMKASDSDD